MSHLRRRLASPSCRRYVFLFLLIVLSLLFLSFLLIGDASEESHVVDGPAGELKVRVIPRIIHQTYIGRRVPQQYWDAVASWHRHHPDYIYFLWTDVDIDRFIATEYPDFIPLFRSYRHKLQRVDAVRYFILFHYGGVYADMDVSALRPLDPLLSRFSCVISRERFEQTMFLWGRPQSLMNAVMASAPRHPFMRFVMLNLHSTRRSQLEMALHDLFRMSHYILASTGPLALTDLFERYPPCRKGTSAACDVYLAPPEQLLPRLKPASLNAIRSYCGSLHGRFMLYFQQWTAKACAQLKANGYYNSLPQEAFTDHKFSNLGYRDPDADFRYRDISELVGKNWRRYSPELVTSQTVPSYVPH